MKEFNNKFILPVCVSVLLLLPGCLGIGEKKVERLEQIPYEAKPKDSTPQLLIVQSEPGEPIVIMDGVPVVTTGDVEKEKANLIESNPQLQMVINMMDPNEVASNIAYGLLQQFLIDKYIAEQGIAATPAYQEELKQGMISVQRMLNAKYFSDSLPVKISDADTRKFYEEHKDSIPGSLISRGGVQTIGVSFSDESEAQNFLSEAEGGDLRALATKKGLGDKVRDFKMISAASTGVDAKIKDTVLKLASVPATTLVKSNTGEFWVVQAQSRKESEYRPYDQIKAEVRNLVDKQKRAEAAETLLQDLRKKYNVTVNEEYMRQAIETQQEIATMSDEFPDLMEMPELPEEIAEAEREQQTNAFA